MCFGGSQPKAPKAPPPPQLPPPPPAPTPPPAPAPPPQPLQTVAPSQTIAVGSSRRGEAAGAKRRGVSSLRISGSGINTGSDGGVNL